MKILKITQTQLLELLNTPKQFKDVGDHYHELIIDEQDYIMFESPNGKVFDIVTTFVGIDHVFNKEVTIYPNSQFKRDAEDNSLSYNNLKNYDSYIYENSNCDDCIINFLCG